MPRFGLIQSSQKTIINLCSDLDIGDCWPFVKCYLGAKGPEAAEKKSCNQCKNILGTKKLLQRKKMRRQHKILEAVGLKKMRRKKLTKL